MPTTRWNDTKRTTIDEALDLLTDAVSDDDGTLVVNWNNWFVEKKFVDNQTIYLNGREITYNLVEYFYDQVTSGRLQVEDRTVRIKGFIIVYFNGTSVNYIISENSKASKTLRRLLSCTENNEVVNSTDTLSNDFFIWVIRRVYTSNDNSLLENDNLTELGLKLQSIKGLSGKIEDSQTTVSADGESVMNIISTLSFLLEDRLLGRVKLDLGYNKHETISLILRKDTVETEFKPYMGIYESDESNRKIAKVYLLIYLEILPILVQAYKIDNFSDLWGKDVYIGFMNDVANNLQEKIKNKLDLINK